MQEFTIYFVIALVLIIALTYRFSGTLRRFIPGMFQSAGVLFLVMVVMAAMAAVVTPRILSG